MVGVPRDAAGVVVSVTAEVKSWQRPAFEPGNQVAVGHGRPIVHGARSRVRVATVAEEIRARLLERVPRLEATPDVVEGYVEVAAIAALYGRDLHNRGLFTRGEPREHVSRLHLQYRRLALQYLKEMGLTPKVQVELQLDLALTARAVEGQSSGRATPRVDAYVDGAAVVDEADDSGEER
jgi:hypothetical protein